MVSLADDMREVAGESARSRGDGYALSEGPLTRVTTDQVCIAERRTTLRLHLSPEFRKAHHL